MANKKHRTCPMCDGKGNIEAATKNEENRLRRRSEIAKQLRKDGYTIREIMYLMGYKSTTSVQLLLGK